MKKHILLYAAAVLLLFGMAQCTPKTGEKVIQPADIATKKIENANDWRSAVPSGGPAPKIQLGKYESFKLENGLNVIVVENHKIPRVSYQLSLDLDGIKEGDIAGMTDMAGDLLGRGTKTRTKSQIDEAIDFIGAYFSTNSNGMYGSSLKKHSDKLLEIMSDVLLNPAFPKDEFDKIKKQTISGLQSQKANAGAIAGNVRKVLNFGKNHAYGEITTEASIEKATLDNCKNYYETYFKPNAAYLVVVGDTNPQEAIATAKKYFGAWKSGAVPPTNLVPIQAAPVSNKVAVVNKQGAVQSVVNVTYPIEFKYGAPDAMATSVMSTILGGDFTSRLNQNLREKHGYTYGANCGLAPNRWISAFNAGANVRTEVTDSSVTQILYELNRIRNEKVDADELSLFKNIMTGNFALSLERPQTIANFALNTARYGLPKDYYETYLERLSRVSAEDVQSAARKYILPENANILVVGNQDKVVEKLKRFSKNGQIDLYDFYGDKIDAPKVKIQEGITGETVLQDYINAIGGKEKLSSIKDMTMVMSAEIQGKKLEMTRYNKTPNKFTFSMGMGGMTMMKQIFDGSKGAMEQMGQKKILEGDDLEDLKSNARMFRELSYKEDGYKIELKGTEKIENTDCYKIEITNKKGNTIVEYFDIKTNLKIRRVETRGAGENTSAVISDYQNYKEVNGVKLPHTITISGAMPIPLKMEATTVKINSDMADGIFKID